MARDVQDVVRDVFLRAIESGGGNGHGRGGNGAAKGLTGVKGVAAGAGAAALVPLAVKNAGRLAKVLRVNGLVDDVVHGPQHALQDATAKIGDHVGSGIGEKVGEKFDEAGGPSGIMKDTLKGALPFGGGGSGGGGGSKGGAPGVGKGRRMPVQQSVDIGVPIETVYNQWTQFEEWPNFMHRVTRVTQEDDCTVSFATKIWGKTKEFTAKIETQRPDERIKWRVSQGLTHTGVVTFHELGPHLTRVLLTMDVQPGGLLEKAARGMRHVKRAARADLHRFKAFIEMAEHETGAWRGVIEDGHVVEEHDPEYDRNREYSDINELVDQQDEDEQDQDEQDQDEQGEDEQDDERDEPQDEQSGDDEEEQRPRRGRSRSQASNSRQSSGRGRSASNSSGAQSRSSSSRSGSSRSRNGQAGSSRTRAGASSGSSGSSGSQRSRRQSRSRNSHGE